MRCWRLPPLLVMCVALGLGSFARAAGPADGASNEQQVRDAADAAMDTAAPAASVAVEAVVAESHLERQFATEMVMSMRAEYGMFRRAAVAVSGDEKSEAVRGVEKTLAVTRDAIAAAKPVINGDTATMPFAPGGGRGTTLHFRKVDGRWKLDLLRRYRERAQINERGIARWKSRQRAAESSAKIYEDKQEKDLDALPLIYETMCRQFDEQVAQPRKPSPADPS